MIKTILLDIDNTLYNYDSAHEKAMAALCDYCKEQFDWEEDQTKNLIKEAQQEQKKRLQKDSSALHNRLIRFQILLEKEEKAIAPYAMEMYQCYWNSIIYHAQIEPGVHQMLQKAKEAYIRIGIATDMTAYIQYRKLAKLGILSMIDFIVTSEEAGAEKPEEVFYRLCLEKAKCRPEECVMIGDSLKKDVKGAQAMGMKAFWYHPQEDANQECVPIIHSFFQLAEVL